MAQDRCHVSPITPSNQLLAALPADSQAALAGLLEPVSLTPGQRLSAVDLPVTYAYFPHTAVVSLLTPLAQGWAVASALVGREGVVGLPAVLGLALATTDAQVELPGTAARIALPAFRVALARDRTLFERLQRHLQVAHAQLAQTGACNRTHRDPERLARWLLEVLDRTTLTTLPLTPAFLAAVLGVRPAAVVLALGPLKQAGYLRYQPGQVTVIDRAGLEGTTCSCYWALQHTVAQLLGPHVV